MSSVQASDARVFHVDSYRYDDGTLVPSPLYIHVYARDGLIHVSDSPKPIPRNSDILRKDSFEIVSNTKKTMTVGLNTIEHLGRKMALFKCLLFDFIPSYSKLEPEKEYAIKTKTLIDGLFLYRMGLGSYEENEKRMEAIDTFVPQQKPHVAMKWIYDRNSCKVTYGQVEILDDEGRLAYIPTGNEEDYPPAHPFFDNLGLKIKNN